MWNIWEQVHARQVQYTHTTHIVHTPCVRVVGYVPMYLYIGRRGGREVTTAGPQEPLDCTSIL